MSVSFQTLSFLASPAAEALAARDELIRIYGDVPARDADVIVALGGDGFMLQTLHSTMNSGRLVYGMNRGSVGFLMNEYRTDALRERINAAVENTFRPLRMTTTNADGTSDTALAINEVSLFRQSYQAAKLRVEVDGVVRLEELTCDGLMVATPAGSTAYNLSAHGPILPLDAPLLAMTPVSAFRPRRWRGALLPNKVAVDIHILRIGEAASERRCRQLRGQVGAACTHRSVGAYDGTHSIRSRPLLVRPYSVRAIRGLRR